MRRYNYIAAVQEIIQWLVDKGLSEKYDYAGVYSISINSTLVYIGKSVNMLKRIAEHIYEIERKNPSTNKYKVLQEARARQYDIAFDVLYYTKRKTIEAIEKDIGKKESVLIHKYLPPLNTQIPKKENFHSYINNQKAKTITLDEILSNQSLVSSKNSHS